MKLSCHLEVRNQLAPTGKKACVCTLALCKDKHNAPILLMCTKQNVAGQKYELKNLKKVFSKFIKEGLATLSFTTPPHDLHIKKADPLQLRSFLHFIANGEKSNLRFSAPPTKVDDPGPKKLVITRRGDLAGPLPRSLESLAIMEIGLLKLPNWTWQLKNLNTLNLTSNVLESVPAELGQLPGLLVLVLARNSLTTLDCFPHLTSLRSLDVSFNKLSSVPESLCDLPSLTFLKLAENQLTRLPNGIGKLRRLNYLDASVNRIEVLPSSFMCLKLQHLNLYKNPLNRAATPVQQLLPNVPTLLEWAAKSTVHHRLKFSPECLPLTLIHYLKTRNQFCAVCSCPVFSSTSPAVEKVDVKTKASEVVGIDHTGRTMAAIEVIRCLKHSQKHLQKWPWINSS